MQKIFGGLVHGLGCAGVGVAVAMVLFGGPKDLVAGGVVLLACWITCHFAD